MNIGITKANTGWDFYIKWLEYFNINFTILDYQVNNSFEVFEKCDGLILTGGVDIFPEIYCDWESSENKGTYIPERDGFELKLLEKAISRNLPVLGICRGNQLINVFFRGNLIFDLEKQRNVNHKKISDKENRLHSVNVNPDSLLYKIVCNKKGIVTSSHHQAIDRLGEGLIFNAKSDDGILEGIEYADKSGKHFLLGIQWHPERFSDFDDAFSRNIILKFISETNKT